jgi:DNA-binding transcriptional ArsR family regulator
VPFNPDGVLEDTPKPPPELTLPKADEVMVRPCPEDNVLQIPVTPLSLEALMSLQRFIIKKSACTLDETSQQILDRHLKKLTKAG